MNASSMVGGVGLGKRRKRRPGKKKLILGKFI
jgi:hypothetical protein